ncbi:MAG: hypothetical protein KF752_19365 [Pirellulaceae bacterium]|nr:hypothetical protein [Pirellulaceae bacterium]
MLVVPSRVAGAAWPAIPTSRASQLLAVQFQLDQSQWLSADELHAHQWQQLQRVLYHACQHVPYYRARLAEIATPIQCGTVDQSDWLSVPLLTRDDLQAAGSQLHCTPMLTNHGLISQSSTSGSTGSPVATLGTTVTRMLWSAMSLRQHLWAGRDFTRKLASIRAFDQAEKVDTEDWGLGTLDIVRTGPATTLSIFTSVQEQAEWLVREQPDYLLTYPSVASALIQHFQRTGQRLNNLRELRTFGEVVEPQLRWLCHQSWGVPLTDVYSTQELGYVAIQCPEVEQHYHIQSENVLLEVLDDDGRQCLPGEVGRVVITTLQNFAMH